MFVIRIADLNVRIENRYDLILGKCQNDLMSGCVPPDLTIGMTETEIVPVYNVDGYLKECIQSLLDQTYQKRFRCTTLQPL